MTIEEIEQAEQALAAEAEALPTEKRKLYFAMSEEAFKDPDTYATLAYLFVSGLHHFYLNRWQRGVLDLVLNAFGLVLLVTGIVIESWIVGLLGPAIWIGVSIPELYYLFHSQAVVREYNLRQQQKILAGLKS